MTALLARSSGPADSLTAVPLNVALRASLAALGIACSRPITHWEARRSTDSQGPKHACVPNPCGFRQSLIAS
jgi:hypothetical protein